MTYPETNTFSTAPVPTAFRAGLRRANLRRRLSGPLMALALLVWLVGVSSLSVPVILWAVALAYFGVRWSGQPVSVWVSTGPLEWF